MRASLVHVCVFGLSGPSHCRVQLDPERLEGIGADGFTRPLRPYPAAEYSGTGDPRDGRNWSCKRITQNGGRR